MTTGHIPENCTTEISKDQPHTQISREMLGWSRRDNV
jgi:hypothetical protein